MPRKIGLVEVFIKEPKYNKDFLVDLWKRTKGMYQISETYPAFEILDPFEIENPVHCDEFSLRCIRPLYCQKEGVVSSYGYYVYFDHDGEPLPETRETEDMWERKCMFESRMFGMEEEAKELLVAKRETAVDFGPKIKSLAKMRKDKNMDILVTVSQGVLYVDLLAKNYGAKKLLEKRLTQPKDFPYVPGVNIIHCKKGLPYEPIDYVLFKNKILVIGNPEKNTDGRIDELAEKIICMRKLKKPQYVIKYENF